MDREACTDISLHFVKFDPRTYFIRNTDPHQLVSSFLTALEGLAIRSKTQIKLKFIQVETAIRMKLCAILKQLNRRHNRAEKVIGFVDDCIVDSEEQDLSTQFLQMQTNQLTDLQKHLEHQCNVLLVFGFNSAKYDINLIKSYLLPILVHERDIEPAVRTKANQFVFFKTGDIQLHDIMNFLGSATILHSFLSLKN